MNKSLDTTFFSCKESTVWNNEKFTLIEKIFREINSLVTSYQIALFSRNYCQKCVRVNFSNVHTVESIVRNQRFQPQWIRMLFFWHRAKQPRTSFSIQNMDTNRTVKASKENVGNCIIAAKDIHPGNVVLNEPPLVLGPNHYPNLVCLECLKWHPNDKCPR